MVALFCYNEPNKLKRGGSMSLKRMWGISFLTILIMFVFLTIAEFCAFNFNIYANHKLLGQIDPGVIRLVGVIFMFTIAKRSWDIKIFQSKHGWKSLLTVGWLMLLIALTNVTISSDSIVWDGILHHMNGLNIFLTFFMALLESLFIGMFEETAMRGIIFGAMLKAFKKHTVMKSVIWSSVFFGGLHALNYGAQPFWDTTNQIIYAMGIGFILAAMYYVTKNIWVPIAAHAIMDYTALVFSMHSIYFNVAGYNDIDLTSVLIFIIGLLVAYITLIKYNRRLGKQDWFY